MNFKHIQILSEAEADLEDGRFFYENQEQGIGICLGFDSALFHKNAL